ncbi:MAG: hypothetical protein R3A12_09865 [Ignavibacteria bacterium]
MESFSRMNHHSKRQRSAFDVRYGDKPDILPVIEVVNQNNLADALEG